MNIFFATPFVCTKNKRWTSYRRAISLAGVCFGLFLSLPAHSQTLGRISGIVTDTSGGSIAEATVTVTDVARGVARTVTTDNAGVYAAPNLILGTYAVHVVFQGFQTFDRQNIQIGVGSDVHVDIILQRNQTASFSQQAAPG